MILEAQSIYLLFFCFSLVWYCPRCTIFWLRHYVSVFPVSLAYSLQFNEMNRYIMELYVKVISKLWAIMTVARSFRKRLKHMSINSYCVNFYGYIKLKVATLQ